MHLTAGTSPAQAIASGAKPSVRIRLVPLLAAEGTVVHSQPMLRLRSLATCGLKFGREQHSPPSVPRLTASDEGGQSRSHHQLMLTQCGETMPGTRLQSGGTGASVCV